ncbi:sushi domain-containing protein 2 isoform X2 [Pygocentrus nattereri]|uniref:sushi domain-containing protein 2 isoform X2 n=1 Tax=Pygocentrus nattereri TaxID=42514 RepID=UPI0018910867|nr:sushi domain-containing protein 2 isoform X2 [Pygocentrus nattereri]
MRLLFILLIWIQMFSHTAAQSCEGRCGEKLAVCSCHSTCDALMDCCVDFKEFCLEISPHSGSLLGGTDFRILNVVFDPSATLTCRFKSEIVTQGFVDVDGVGHCVSPMLFESGWIPFEVSTDGVNYNRAGRWLSAHHSKLDVAFKLLLVNGTQWQYYGTPGVGGVLLMVWNASLINAERVNVELWGYEETGEPYSEHWQADWTYLYTVGKDVLNNGAFSFTPKPTEVPLSNWHMGSMRVSPSTKPDGAQLTMDVTSKKAAFALTIQELCTVYEPYRAASVLGDPHFITFDGATYTFNGKGEYVLLQSAAWSLSVQGRTGPMKSENGSVIMATRLSSVAMKEMDSDVIEVRLTDRLDHLQVLMNQEELSFSEQSWMDLKGVFVFSAVPQNVTVMFPSGAGVEVRGRGGVMALTVLLPLEFNNHTQGLLGKMNDNPADDLTSSDGVITPANSSPQDIFTFGAGWAVSNESSLFTYDSQLLLNEYHFGPKHDPSFIPSFSVTEDPSDTLLEPTLRMCSGVGAEFCKYDALISRSLELGNSTLLTQRSHAATMQDLQLVVSCGWLQPPRRGHKEGTLYLQGAKISFSCDHGYCLHGSQERVCQEDGQWSGNDTHCVSDNILGIALGSAAAVLTLIIMVVAIVLHSKKQKRQKIKEVEDQEVYQPQSVDL